MEDTWGIPGPTFLAIYAALLVLPLVIALLWTIAVKLGHKAPRAAVSGPRPTAYELAYLAGGPDRVVDTAIAALVDRGTLRISSSRKLQLAGPEPADPIERAVARSAKPGHNSTTRGIRDRLRMSGPMQALGKDLEERGLVVVDKTPQIRQVVFSIYLGALILGVVRLIAGIASDHPVGFLIFLVIVAGFATLLARAARNKRVGPRPTSEGNRIVGRANTEFSRERGRGITGGPAVGGALLGGAALAVALGGLAYYPDEELSAALIPPPLSGGFGGGGSSGGSTCSTGGSSCSSGSSCGGGGSSCGGGGCGG